MTGENEKNDPIDQPEKTGGQQEEPKESEEQNTEETKTDAEERNSGEEKMDTDTSEAPVAAEKKEGDGAKTDSEQETQAGPDEETVKNSDNSEPGENIEDIAVESDEETKRTDVVPREIFVVLCEREDINQDCIDVLQNHGTRSIVVNKPEETRSIAEILNEHSRVRFALILLAGDNFIYDRNTGKPGEALLSAKPNNVFHLGYLLAKFGNQGTLAIYREQKSFRLPTGLQNAAFVPYQKGRAWEEILRSKLKASHIIS